MSMFSIVTNALMMVSGCRKVLYSATWSHHRMAQRQHPESFSLPMLYLLQVT